MFRIGVQRVVDEPGLLPGARVGLLTNYTGVLADLSPNVTGLLGVGVPVVALFAPEHGLRGTVQAGLSEPETRDEATDLPLYDTYLHEGAALDALIADSGIDVLAFDLADIGTRFYTYVWTMADLMAACRRVGVRCVVLDRPNPVTGRVAEGPLLDPAYASFVGRAPIPLRHGLTAGELARYLDPDVEVVEMVGWRRGDWYEVTGLPWVMPSVNIPTLDSALCYPGTGLFEGTNVSEGRGTTRPFELVGAPYVDSRWVAALRGLQLPGVAFRDAWFCPTFHKYAGRRVQGVQLHVTDREAFRPVATAVAMLHLLRVLYPEEFRMREPDSGGRYFLDLLWGAATLREALVAGDDPRGLVGEPSSPHEWTGGRVMLYH